MFIGDFCALASQQRIFGAVRLAEEEGFETEVRRLVGAGLLLGSRRLESCSVWVARNQLGRLPKGNWDPTFSAQPNEIRRVSANYRGAILSGRCALRTPLGLPTAPLDPFPQHLIDACLPAWAGCPEMAQHLRRQANMRMYLRIGLLRPAARASKRALRRAHDLAADCQLSAIKLLFCPLWRFVWVNPNAPGNALFRGHCTSSSRSRGDPCHARSRPP